MRRVAGKARIKKVGKYQSCMVSKLPTAVSTVHRYGCDLLGDDSTTDQNHIDAAVAAAKEADVIILGLGIGSCGTWKQYDQHDRPLNAFIVFLGTFYTSRVV